MFTVVSNGFYIRISSSLVIGRLPTQNAATGIVLRT